MVGAVVVLWSFRLCSSAVDVVMGQGWLRGRVSHIGRPVTAARHREGPGVPAVPPFVAVASTFVGVLSTRRALRWGYVPVAPVVGRVRPAGVAAGAGRTHRAVLDRSVVRSWESR